MACRRDDLDELLTCWRYKSVVGHRSRSNAAEPSLLAGLVTDARGERLTPSHAVKKGRRYRYYISAALISEAETGRAPGLRLAATELDVAVIRILLDTFANSAKLLELFGTADMPAEQVRKLLGRAKRLAAMLNALTREASYGGTRPFREGHHR